MASFAILFDGRTRHLHWSKWESSNVQVNEQIDELYAIYSDRFREREIASKLILNRYPEQDWPRVPMLDRPEFENWLLDDWRTPFLKREWLSTFLELSDDGLHGLTIESQEFVASLLSKLPSELKLAS